jgi:NitT/TauT family transport system ATP-binding protein
LTGFIELNDVSKTFRVDDGVVEALAPTSFGLSEGEFVSLVGPSGCGKSTLLRILAGLIPASRGMVRVAGEQVRAPRPDVGIVFQQPVLLPWLSVISNIMLPVKVARRRQRLYRDRAEQLLRLVGLEGFGQRLPAQLSGGMQQRAAICRALILEPKVLLMDEPFGALDALTREEMGFELLRIWSEVGATVLFITHSISEAVLLSDRVLVMSRRPGRIIKTLDIALGRPRGVDTFVDPRFTALTGELRNTFENAATSATQRA